MNPTVRIANQLSEDWMLLIFVFALMLLISDRWMLLKTITAFTVAHSITLPAFHGGRERRDGAPLMPGRCRELLPAAEQLLHRGRARRRGLRTQKGRGGGGTERERNPKGRGT
jgi:hypothetical protein